MAFETHIPVGIQTQIPARLDRYAIGAALMLAAAGVAIRYGVQAERVGLESVARPLSSEME